MKSCKHHALKNTQFANHAVTEVRTCKKKPKQTLNLFLTYVTGLVIPWGYSCSDAGLLISPCWES